ncbi:MAG TPA: GNAT family N-acetyltransferase [Polyangiaceae bacterium]|jgi:GNAT superfamily N-acetyltransferase
MNIAPATPTELEDVASLLAGQFAEHAIVLDEATFRGAIRGALEEPGRGTFLLARGPEERAIGLAYLTYTWTLEHGGRSAWLEELYVVPEERARGYGAELLAAAMAHAKAQACRAIDLEVEAEHARAANLYQRAGFRPHRRARWYVKL